MPRRQPLSMRDRLQHLRDLFPLPPSLCLLTLGCLLLTGTEARAAEAQDGVALAIVYDTSGSMREPVRTADGQRAAKYVIGNRALEHIVHRIERFATNASAPRVVHAGLFVFNGTGVREAVKFGPFEAQRLLDWIKSYRGPNSGTPLGTALDAASKAVLNSKLTQKHVL